MVLLYIIGEDIDRSTPIFFQMKGIKMNTQGLNMYHDLLLDCFFVTSEINLVNSIYEYNELLKKNNAVTLREFYMIMVESLPRETMYHGWNSDYWNKWWYDMMISDRIKKENGISLIGSTRYILDTEGYSLTKRNEDVKVKIKKNNIKTTIENEGIDCYDFCFLSKTNAVFDDNGELIISV